MMARFVVRFETDNAAFDGAEFPEIAETLRRLADRVECPETTYGSVRDVNGNTIGFWEWDGRP